MKYRRKAGWRRRKRRVKGKQVREKEREGSEGSG